MITCTFAGHREPLSPQDALLIPERIDEALNHLLNQGDEFHFFFGGMGWFDQRCARAVWNAKKLHPHKRMQLTLVLPYKRKIEGENLYDEILLPDALKRLHYRAAIPQRNRWMVEHSQYLIAYVRRASGGAAATLRFAGERGISIRNLVD